VKKSFAPDAVGEALHHDGPTGEVGKHGRGNAPVVLHEVALGERARPREQHLVRVRQLDQVGSDSQPHRQKATAPASGPTLRPG